MGIKEIKNESVIGITGSVKSANNSSRGIEIQVNELKIISQFKEDIPINEVICFLPTNGKKFFHGE